MEDCSKYYNSRFILYSVYPLTKKGEEEEKGETYNPVDYHRVKKWALKYPFLGRSDQPVVISNEFWESWIFRSNSIEASFSIIRLLFMNADFFMSDWFWLDFTSSLDLEVTKGSNVIARKRTIAKRIETKFSDKIFCNFGTILRN